MTDECLWIQAMMCHVATPTAGNFYLAQASGRLLKQGNLHTGFCSGDGSKKPGGAAANDEE